MDIWVKRLKGLIRIKDARDMVKMKTGSGIVYSGSDMLTAEERFVTVREA